MRSRSGLGLIVICGVLLALGAAPAAGAGPEGAWSTTGELGEPRAYHTATLLADGRVLVAGGYTGGPLATAEVYDPATGLWTATGSLDEARVNHAATLLPDGRVLVTGGSAEGVTKASAEVYDPATGLWASAGTMLHPRQIHTVTLLEDGRLLVAGGTDGYSDLQSSEVYDPSTGLWEATGSLETGRRSARAVRLADGRVLVIGGLVTNAPTGSAEVYDPDTGLWGGAGSLATPRYNHTATLLDDGLVLVAGGTSTVFYPTPLSSTELYDPGTGLWTSGSDLLAARLTHSATLLPAGQVLVAGGLDADISPLATAELFDPVTGTWGPTGSLQEARASHSATLLASGTVLAAGGGGLEGNLVSAELYLPEAHTMHVSRIAGWLTVDEFGRPLMVMHVRVLDEGGNPLGLVQVDASISPPAGGTFQRSRLTKSAGYARFAWGSSTAGSWSLCVDDLALAGFTYAPEDNVLTCREWYN